MTAVPLFTDIYQPIVASKDVTIARVVTYMHHSTFESTPSYHRLSMQVAGKVFRIGHLGNMDSVMMLGALAGKALLPIFPLTVPGPHCLLVCSSSVHCYCAFTGCFMALIMLATSCPYICFFAVSVCE